jgi:DNA-binding GntR family transcriptional regulator
VDQNLRSDEFASTARSVVVARLKDDILSGRTPHGTRLRQADVAARFGISTTPVREAFRELATLGLVQIEPHRGATVLRFSSAELSHIYEVRILLEPVCVAWAAQRITPGEVDQAAKLIEQMRHTQVPDEVIALNRKFHALLARACGNRHLGDQVMNLLDLSTPYIARVAASSADRTAHQMAEHEEILHACERGDAASAYRASLRHLTQLHIPSSGEGSEPMQPATDISWLPFDLSSWLLDTSKTAPKVRRRAQSKGAR